MSKRVQNNTQSTAKRLGGCTGKGFTPGRSGNPGGRPKDDVAAEIARAVFSENRELIYKAFVKALEKGNAYAFQVLADRAYGKLKETSEVTHKYEDVPDGDLQREIDGILDRLGLARQIDAIKREGAG